MGDMIERRFRRNVLRLKIRCVNVSFSKQIYVRVVFLVVSAMAVKVG